VSADVTFVLCVENNATRAQALLLCESIRRFGGRHCDAPIVAIAPRPGLGIDDASRRLLGDMNVEYVEEPLNRVCPEYGSANRVFAAAWAETRSESEWIVVLDSDTVVLGELELPADADIAARPIDSKGSATAGPGDPFEEYWASLAALDAVSLDCLPFVQTTDQCHVVRASYNGGLIVSRRECGVLSRWADLFARSVSADLKPWKGRGENVFSSTGFVGTAASEYWGSNQAAVALAIWSSTKRVRHYPDSYNVPLHLLMARPDLVAGPRSSPPVHIHYHWVFGEQYYKQALATLRDLGVSPGQLEWLTQRLPLQ
jgi:hypothetical protein